MVMDAHLRDLRYFLAVAEHANFTRAAEALYVSQPALSKQIRALERQLRVTLFERDPSSVRLTRAGVELVPPAACSRRCGPCWWPAVPTPRSSCATPPGATARPASQTTARTPRSSGCR